MGKTYEKFIRSTVNSFTEATQSRWDWVDIHLGALKDLPGDIVSFSPDSLAQYDVCLADDLPWKIDEETPHPETIFCRPCALTKVEFHHKRGKKSVERETDEPLDEYPPRLIEHRALESLSLEEWQARHFHSWLHESPASVERESIMDDFDVADQLLTFVECQIMLPAAYHKVKGLFHLSSWKRLYLNREIPAAKHFFHRVLSPWEHFSYCTGSIFRPFPWPQPEVPEPDQFAKDAKLPMGYHLYMHRERDSSKQPRESFAHLASSLATGAQADDNILLRSELHNAYRMIIDQMCLPWYHEHDIFPVFVYSFVAYKARVLQAYFDPNIRKLIVRKTSFLPLEGPEHLQNVKMLMAWMASEPCGQTRNLIGNGQMPVVHIPIANSAASFEDDDQRSQSPPDSQDSIASWQLPARISQSPDSPSLSVIINELAQKRRLGHGAPSDDEPADYLTLKRARL